MRVRLFLLGLVFLTSLPSRAATVHGEHKPLWLAHESKAIDCRVGRVIWPWVCSNPALLAQDGALMATYQQLRKKLSGDRLRAFVIQQSSWAWSGRGPCARNT